MEKSLNKKVSHLQIGGFSVLALPYPNPVWHPLGPRKLTQPALRYTTPCVAREPNEFDTGACNIHDDDHYTFTEFEGAFPYEYAEGRA